MSTTDLAGPHDRQFVVEELAGAVPIAGDLFDIAWRANRRNVRLLREYFEREGLL